ncbi:hypothetical protein B0H16DRAFT_1880417 [Mycena metata]|uniref:F-box domain-containing protein n=1 Tax=Mycena metata TaxID=1033252 RepID=A0AAD7JZM3_9AGAR|nr:hypothetical protein B0H16DRAFT_1880417 [Mycena metata]
MSDRKVEAAKSSTINSIRDARSSALERLPTEMLCEIFRATLPWSRRLPPQENEDIDEIDDDEDIDAASLIGSEVGTPPWRLGLVCKRWRECAVGDPTLWVTVDIQCDDITADQITEFYPLAALEAQILRSRDAPLNVAFLACAFTDLPPLAVGLLQALVQESHRWERAVLGLGPKMLTELAPIRGRLQLLESLELLSPAIPPALNDIFGAAPQLRKVYLTDHDDENSLTRLSVPWGQITHLRAQFSAVCVDVLCRTHLLVECNLWLHSNVSPFVTAVAVLPRLRRLSVNNTVLLQALKTPNLEYLFLVFYDRNVTINSAAFVVAFLQRSQCQLKGLSGSNCSAGDLTPVLANTPTLLHLHVHFQFAGVIHETARLQELPNIGICPQLISITLHLGWERCDYAALYDSIMARIATLKFVSFCGGTSSAASVEQRLLALRSEALDVFINDFDARATKDMVNDICITTV